MLSDAEERRIENMILRLSKSQKEDLICEHPGVQEWLKDRKAGYDVESMLEDYGPEYGEVEQYIKENFRKRRK